MLDWVKFLETITTWEEEEELYYHLNSGNFITTSNTRQTAKPTDVGQTLRIRRQAQETHIYRISQRSTLVSKLSKSRHRTKHHIDAATRYPSTCLPKCTPLTGL